MQITKLNLKRTAIIGMLLMPTSMVFADKEKEITGCYQLQHGYYEISRAADFLDILGQYRVVLSKGPGSKGRLVLSGALKGTPHTQVPGGFITRHVLATKERIGTLTSEDDPFTIISASCPDANGNPQYIEATEAFEFVKATGKFSGLISGNILFSGAFDACTDPNNPTADFEAVSGEICFK